jgi:streptogramin lyase
MTLLGASLPLAGAPAVSAETGARACDLLGLLPDGEEKRKFILDCMGCHSLSDRILYVGGTLLDEAGYQASVQKMLMFSGAKTSFPVMSPERDPAATAAFLAKSLTEEGVAKAATRSAAAERTTSGFTVGEWGIPDLRDLPHDLIVTGDGKVLVTGMLTGRMYVLDPETGAWQDRPIPSPGGNPRALDVAQNGDWWVAGGMTKAMSRFRVSDGIWDHYDIGVYPHSIARPIPYGLRVGPDDTIWSTELGGNRLLKYVPDSGRFTSYYLPTTYSGPRRIDVASDGTVWVPEFATGRIARFDPRTEAFTEYDFPTKDSLPYCVRIDHARGLVWVSQCANDAIARIDTRTMEIVEYALPTPVAFIRHLGIDKKSGDVYAAYSHSPGLHPKVVRLRVE